jgi:hypothetical protein
VEVAELREVAPHDDEVHAPLVLDVVVAKGQPLGVEHAEREPLRPTRRERRACGRQPQAARGDREPGHVGRRGLRLAVLGLAAAAAVDGTDAGAGGEGDAEDAAQREHEREAAAGGSRHAAS